MRPKRFGIGFLALVRCANVSRSGNRAVGRELCLLQLPRDAAFVQQLFVGHLLRIQLLSIWLSYVRKHSYWPSLG